MRTLSLDPGISGTGWAVWDRHGRDCDWQKIVPPLAVGVIMPKGGEYIARTQSITEKLALTLKTHKVSDVVCEFPEYFGDTAKGYAATSDGSIYKLAFFIGAVAQLCFDRGIIFNDVNVTTWKGQLPKEVITKRIVALLGIDACTNLCVSTHAWDAVGIGLYAKGHRFTS